MIKKSTTDPNQILRSLRTTFSLHPLFFLHPALLPIAGYFIVSKPFPPAIKVVVFLLICLAGAWLMYQLMMRPSLHPPVLADRNDISGNRKKKSFFDNSYLKDQLLIT